MKRLILTFSLLVCGYLLILAQYEPEPTSRKGKVFLIPEFWLSFGSSTYIEVAPLLGYHVSDRFSVGLGPHYIYQSWRATPYNPAFQTHVWGIKGFGRFALITNAEKFLPIKLFSDLFVHMEYEGMSLENGVYGAMGDQERYFIDIFLIGGGLSQRIGMYSSISFMVLWNLNETSASPYSNPIFRIGFNAFF